MPSCAGAFAFVAVAAVSLTACVSSGLEPSAVNVTPLVAVTPVDLEGSWGLASYRTEADKDRTIKEAKSACGNPYVVGKGSNGGVVMHLADKPQPQEVFLKVASTGQVYLGPKGKAGLPQDRLIVSYGDGVLVSQWVDPGTAERYGTMVFVRCG